MIDCVNHDLETGLVAMGVVIVILGALLNAYVRHKSKLYD